MKTKIILSIFFKIILNNNFFFFKNQIIFKKNQQENGVVWILRKFSLKNKNQHSETVTKHSLQFSSAINSIAFVRLPVHVKSPDPESFP